MVAQLETELAQRGYTVTCCDQLTEVVELSHQHEAAGQLHCVVAAGGDGTAAAVVNIIPRTAKLAIFPLGTENLLAKHLQLTNDPVQAATIIDDGRTVQLDAGMANERLFLVMLSCGFDAAVVMNMHQVRTGHINRWSYAKPIWWAIRSYNYPMIEVRCLDGDQSEPASQNVHSNAWVFAFNLPRYAAELSFCPQAIGDDGWLDVCTFKRGGLWAGLGYLWRLWRGKHQQLKDFRHVRSRKFRLTAPQPVPYQIDGDPGGYLPLDIEVLPNRLTLIVP